VEFPHAFGRYQLLSRLATGGMAEVFLARSLGIEGFEKRLVIKKILPGLAYNPRYIELFIQEAKTCAALSHPNIVQVFELGKAGDVYFIAMEHIQGKDLLKVLRILKAQEQKMSPELAVAIAAFAARGLACAHEQLTSDGKSLCILHRDVSPHNIVISFEGEVKLVDFGIAQLAKEEVLIRPGGGKQPYMAPEQRSGGMLGPGVDIFALGATLFEMLAGRRLFSEEDEASVDIAARCQDLPAPLTELLLQMMAADPESRPSARQVETHLRSWLFENGVHSSMPAIGALMRQLFAEELAGNSKADLDRLVQDFEELHTGIDGSHGSQATPPALISRAARLQGAVGERKSVVVMVVESCGLTEIFAKAEIEEQTRLNYRVLRAIRRVLDRLGGVACRFEDGLLLVMFGLPKAHGDDLERALACALELHRLSNRLKKRRIPVEFAIGVHTGEVTVGRKQRAHWRFSAQGDTVKTCMRLAWLADPGKTLVSDKVVTLCGERFPFDRGPKLYRKGTRQHSRPSFLLTGGRRGPGKAGGGRFYRRRDELEVLKNAIAELKTGVGSRLLVRGEAGIGKSMFFREIRDLATRRGVPVLQGRALPFGQERPFSAFREIVSDILGTRADMPLSELKDRLSRLRELGLGDAEIATISMLFGVGSTQEPSRDAMFTALGRIVRGVSSEGPVIVMIEDVQHLEPVEQALVEQLLKAAEDERVLVLLSSREPVDFYRKLKEFLLGPLDCTQTKALAAELLGVDALGPELQKLLKNTCEGNPLYISEILKGLSRSNRIVRQNLSGSDPDTRLAEIQAPTQDLGLPDTLLGLIAARIDALEAADKRILQLAAVIGASFSKPLLAAAMGLEDSERLLEGLLRAGLVVADREETGVWQFVSSLVWECVSRSIPGPLRKEYHRMVATGLEQLFPEPGATRRPYDVWALHCFAGGRVRDAAEGMALAADALREAQFLDRALTGYQQALNWVELLPRSEAAPRLEAKLNLGAGEVAIQLGFPRAERYLQVALDLSGEYGPELIEGQSLLALGKLSLSKGKGMMARTWLEGAVSIFKKLGELSGQVQALEALGLAALEEGKAEVAAAFFEEGLKVAGEQVGLGARMLLGLAAKALQQDKLEAAQEFLQRAEPLAGQDRILQGRVLNNLGIVHFLKDDFAEALKAFQAALELRRGLGYRWGEVVNLHNIGDSCLCAGDLSGAYAAFEQSRQLAKDCAWDRGVAMNDIYLWYLRGLKGEVVAVELERTAALCQRLGDREMALVGRWLVGRLKGSKDLVTAVRIEAEQAGFVSLARRIGRE
jgi:class 3 adenylate cyclase/tetratricopeptide (TPR) repeat protein